MSVGGLFALLLLIALAVSMALLKPQVPGRIVFAGFAAGVFLLPMFETHYSRLSVFSFILMLVGFLHGLAAWLTEGRPRPPWLEWLLDPAGRLGLGKQGRRGLAIGLGALVLTVGLYLLATQPAPERPAWMGPKPVFPHPQPDNRGWVRRLVEN